MAPDRRLAGWVLPSVAAALAVLQLAAFRWGVVTPDTVWQYEQALAGRYDDWHPPVMAWIWRWLGAARFGGAPLLLFDLALYWTGALALAEALRRTGRQGGAAAAVALAALPIPFGQEGALLKDAMLAAACLAATGLLACRTSEDHAAARRRVTNVAIFAALWLASATRINAVFATAPLLAMATPLGWRRGWRWLVSVAVAAAVATAAAALLNQALLRPHHSRPILSLVNFDLAGIAAHGGGNPYPELSTADAARLTAACYSPALYGEGNDACEAVEEGLRAWVDAHRVAPTALWLRAIAAHPVAWAWHRLAHLNLNWRLWVPGVPGDAVYVMSADNDLGLRFRSNRLSMAVHHAAQAMAWSPLGRPATWVALALGLLLAGSGPPLARALAWSALLYGGGYALVSVAPDLRYNLWTGLAAGAAWILAWPETRTRRMRALAPAAVIALVELAALALA